MIPLILSVIIIVGAIEPISGVVTTTVNSILAYPATHFTNTSTSLTSQPFSLDNIETKKVRIGDIDIAHKIFGKGKPYASNPRFFNDNGYVGS